MKNLKKVLVWGLLVSGFLLPFFALASFDQNLKYGSKGSSVVELQKFLITEKCLTGEATGNFYSATQKGVICFQKKHNLPETGYFGPATREAVKSTVTQNQNVSKVKNTPSISTPTASPSTPSVSSTGSTKDDYYTNVEGNSIHKPVYTNTAPAGATAQCRDGSYSFSQHRRGTCSGHGGVANWL